MKTQIQKNEFGMVNTTYALEGLHEANSLVKAALKQKTILPKYYDEMAGLQRLNVHYKEWRKWLEHAGRSEGALTESLRQIEQGNPAIEEQAVKLCREIYNTALDIEPSLSLETPYRPAEEGDIWDAGKIAEGSTIPFFNRHECDRPRQGRSGDGAFRILINTDVHWDGDPCAQCATLMALTLTLQRSAPVEIWIQQGWLGCEPGDGVTLFRVFSGGQLLPRNIWFWIGSPFKDIPYSFIVNKMLGRSNTSTSRRAAMPCDLYMRGNIMPDVSDSKTLAEWVAKTSVKLFFEEELPENWTGS